MNYETVVKILSLLAGVMGLVFLWVWGLYNSLIRKRNQVKTDLSDINIQLGRKAALVGRLTEMVAEYSKHEKGTFENVAKARTTLQNPKNIADSVKAENMLTDTLRSLMMVVESYPKLLASQNYRDLRDDLKQIEASIADYREAYNLTVQDFNNSIQTFPNLLIAKIFWPFL